MRDKDTILISHNTAIRAFSLRNPHFDAYIDLTIRVQYSSTYGVVKLGLLAIRPTERTKLVRSAIQQCDWQNLNLNCGS